MKAQDQTTRRQRVGFVFISIAAVVMAFAMGRGAWHPSGLIAVSDRKPMPLLELRQLDGGMWKLADHRGRVVVVNYWASWCTPCWEETPALLRLSQEVGMSGLAVVGVAMDEGSSDHVDAEVRRFVLALHINYPIAFPAQMSQMAYGMEELPTTILVDRRGSVAKVYSGAIREKDIRAEIKVLLAEATPPSDQFVGLISPPK
jgi:cytochrome c biogenesis protein CcmG, thiol:disulfide interchange protein DsbE